MHVVVSPPKQQPTQLKGHRHCGHPSHTHPPHLLVDPPPSLPPPPVCGPLCPPPRAALSHGVDPRPLSRPVGRARHLNTHRGTRVGTSRGVQDSAASTRVTSPVEKNAGTDRHSVDTVSCQERCALLCGGIAVAVRKPGWGECPLKLPTITLTSIHSAR